MSVQKNRIYQEIKDLHSQWSMMDKASKLRWLIEEKIQLNRLTNQLAQNIQSKGGFSNNDERAYARMLLDMILEVDTEGTKLSNDIADDFFKEIIGRFIR